MIRKTLKMLVVALIAAFALSSMAEAAAPKKTQASHQALVPRRVGRRRHDRNEAGGEEEAAPHAARQSQRDHDEEDAGEAAPEHEAALTPAADVRPRGHGLDIAALDPRS